MSEATEFNKNEQSFIPVTDLNDVKNMDYGQSIREESSTVVSADTAGDNANPAETKYREPHDTSPVSRGHCRFCATEMASGDLFDLSTEDIIEKYQKLLVYLKLEVDFSPTNKLPKQACGSCHNTCLETYRFFLKVKKAQDELNAIYNNVTYVLEVEGAGNKEVPMEIDVIQNMVVGKGVIKTEVEDGYDDAHLEQSSSDEEVQLTDLDDLKLSKDTITQKPASKSLKQPKTEATHDVKPKRRAKKTAYKVKKVPMKVLKSETNVKNVNFSWASYLWSCDHCKAELDTMENLRLHSRFSHNYCYGFTCVDCNDEFNTFNAFVEHVRMHREYLRLYCQYCNKKFRTKMECVAHTLTHWSDGQKICELCGEIFPSQGALTQHKSSYRTKPLTHNTRRKRPRLVEGHSGSWDDYIYTCQDCYQVMPNVHTLRSHVREIHMKCFAMKCADCLRVHRCHGDLVKHVHGHRPGLKNYCHYCNQHFTNPEDMDAHVEVHFSGPQTDRPCFGCGEIFQNEDQLRKHIFEFGALRRPGPHSEDEVTCDICSKNCVTVGKLKIHRKIHEYKERCFVCDTCGNSYFNYWTYQSHIKVHGERTEICKICKKGFPTKVKLKNHAKTHLVDRPYSCEQCGSAFKTKTKLTRHQMIHTDAKPYVCVICDKSFRQKNGLKVHSAQHTGVRPYQCEFCDRTFTNNPNRDKHMRRRHGVPLYKAKEAPKEIMDSNAKEWLNQVTANQKKRKDVNETVVEMSGAM
ncbi:zinc finger protein 431-like [Amyelois transitella]|uniref:zinc finger protein 431-like n=1 Tax=Amyelois transitella TaxID=680683 RepID=UPI0029903359|nr:zinc finger protein 431-like [Amyelois transitella]